MKVLLIFGGDCNGERSNFEKCYEWTLITQGPEDLMTYEVNQEFHADEKLTLKKAEKQGKKRGIMRVSLRMIQKGIYNQTIPELTDLTKEEVERIRK